MIETSLQTKAPFFQFMHILEVLLRPQKAFTLLNQEGTATWVTPMLALTISTTLSVIVSGYFKARAAMLGEMPLPRDWEWTPEMQNNYMQAQQSMQGPVFTYIIPLIGSLLGLWLGWLVLGGLLHLGSTLFGGRGSMRSALNITGWASLPFLVRDVLRIVFMLIAGHSIQNVGLSGFAGDSAFIIELLARFDVFLIWSVVLLGIGFSIADNFPRSKAYANVVIISLLLLLIQAGLGVVLSGLSGLAVQRPFF